MTAPSVPSVALVSIGDELLNGSTVNTNAAWLGGVLSREGLSVVRVVTVGDDPEEIVEAVRWGRSHADLVVCSGGLGPTEDDRTRDAVAAALGLPLIEDATVVDALRERFGRTGREMPASNRRQACFPDGARILANPLGSAPGFSVEAGAGGALFALPGVPAEFRRLTEDHVLPWCRRRWSAEVGALAHRLLRTTGVSESGIADRIEALAGLEEASIAYLPRVAGVDLHIRARHDAVAERVAAAIAAELGDAVYATEPLELTQVVSEQLRRRGWTIATAESCTGGMLAARITDFPGASDVVRGGIVAYANDVKSALVGVPAAAVEEHGAVSEPVARALAEGAAARLGADVGVGITGIAGPDGGSPEKPVGTVHIAVATPSGTESRRLLLPGNRDAVRRRSVQAALDLVRRVL